MPLYTRYPWYMPVQEADRHTAPGGAPAGHAPLASHIPDVALSVYPRLHEQDPEDANPLAGAEVWVPGMLEQASATSHAPVVALRVYPELHEQTPPEAYPLAGAEVWFPAMLAHASGGGTVPAQVVPLQPNGFAE